MAPRSLDDIRRGSTGGAEMTRSLAVAASLLAFGALLASDPWADVPAEDVARTNPVPADEESTARGHEAFTDLCAPCHADDGSGNPEMETALDVEVGDLSPSGTLVERTDGEIHWRIRKGSAEMPEFEADLPGTQLWDVVNYVRLLGAASEDGWTAPSEEGARPNPIDADEESLARGKKRYQRNCAPCHGKKGKGDGGMAQMIDVPPEDLTRPALLAGMSDGELHWKIRTGREPMPAFQEDIPVDEIWDIVNYIRTLPKRKKGGK